MNTKNIIISFGAILLIGLMFVFQSKPTNTNQLIEEHDVNASSTEEIVAATATSTETPITQSEKKEKSISGLTIIPGSFHYDINIGKNQCGEKIGTLTISSTNPTEIVYWELQGMKPIWMNVSSTYGETPAQVDMTYNCIMSGTSNGDYQYALDVMQTNKDGSKPIHKYLFAIVFNGKITLESK